MVEPVQKGARALPHQVTVESLGTVEGVIGAQQLGKDPERALTRQQSQFGAFSPEMRAGDADQGANTGLGVLNHVQPAKYAAGGVTHKEQALAPVPVANEVHIPGKFLDLHPERGVGMQGEGVETSGAGRIGPGSADPAVTLCQLTAVLPAVLL